jgi:hypothetical protein
MANQWFRLYAEFSSDPKVQMMSEAMQRRLVMLFCMRCSDVTVTLSDEEIAFQLRISSEELAETKALFVAKGFINNSWEIVHWEERQFASDSSTARTKAYRDRKKLSHVTSQEQVCDALEQNRTEQKREEKKEIPRKRAPSKTALPENFGITERVRAWAAEKGHNRLEQHLESFRAKATAKGYTYADWDAAFMEAIRENWAKLPTGAENVIPMEQRPGGGRRAL